MVDLFFHNNVANSFKMGKYIALNEIKNKASKNDLEDSKVIVIELDLDIGLISLIKEQNEMAWQSKRLEGNFYRKTDLERIWRSSIEAIDTIKKAVKEAESVRIWWSDVSAEICGFYYAISLLKNSKGKIISIKIPFYNKLSKSESEFVYNHGSTIIEEDQWNALKKYGNVLKTKEMKEIASYWKLLEKENAPIRVQINGNLLGVKESFYDQFIYDFIEQKKVMVREIMGRLSDLGFSLPLWWIVLRLKQLDDLNKIKISKQEPIFENALVQLIFQFPRKT